MQLTALHERCGIIALLNLPSVFYAYWEAHLKPWDYAVGVLLVNEADGHITTYAGQPWRLGETQMIASNGQAPLHQALVDGIAAARRGV